MPLFAFIIMITKSQVLGQSVRGLGDTSHQILTFLAKMGLAAFEPLYLRNEWVNLQKLVLLEREFILSLSKCHIV